MSNLPTKFLTGKLDRVESLAMWPCLSRPSWPRHEPATTGPHTQPRAVRAGGPRGSISRAGERGPARCGGRARAAGARSLPHCTPARIRSALVVVLRVFGEPIKRELGLALHLPKRRKQTSGSVARAYGNPRAGRLFHPVAAPGEGSAAFSLGPKSRRRAA